MWYNLRITIIGEHTTKQFELVNYGIVVYQLLCTDELIILLTCDSKLSVFNIKISYSRELVCRVHVHYFFETGDRLTCINVM